MVSAFSCENVSLRTQLMDVMIVREEFERAAGGVCALSGVCEVGVGYWLVRPFTSSFTTAGFAGRRADQTDDLDKGRSEGAL